MKKLFNSHKTLVTALSVLSIGVFPSASAAISNTELKTKLSNLMANSSAYSGAYVADVATGRQIFGWKSDVTRIPASVEKLYTTSTLLVKDGPDSTLNTTVLSDIPIDDDGNLKGNLYLKGNGDPSLSSKSTTGSSIADLADQLVNTAGLKKVRGRVLGDESAFDNIRGVPDSGWAISPYVGPLSGLTINRGFTNNRYQTNPAKTAAQALTDELQKEGVLVMKRPSTETAPSAAAELASTSSPTMSQLAASTNKPSDNFYAETLLKGLGARYGNTGSTTAGAAVVKSQQAKFGIYPKIVDGSGLSRSNRTSPRQVVAMLRKMAQEDSYEAFKNSLAIAGHDGTLAKRMRRTAASGHCHAKTGTLSNVSGLAGYCDTKGGQTLAFAVIMNATSPYSARKIQDRMVAAIASLSHP